MTDAPDPSVAPGSADPASAPAPGAPPAGERLVDGAAIARMLVQRYRALPSWQVTLSFALLGLGFLIAAQLASEGPRVRYTSQERSPLVETALRLQSDQEALKVRLLQARDRIAALESQGPNAATEARDLEDALAAARLAAGLTAVGGPGVVLRLDDPASGDPDGVVTSRDLRILVDELWLAGAEAIAINGERVTSTTAVLDIGSSILANSAYLAPPYTISAIGRPGMYDRMRASVSFIEFVRSRIERYGMGLSVAQLDEVTLPAYAGTLRVRFSLPDATEAPG